LKLGWITVSGKKEFVSDALKRLEVISDAFLSVNTPVQIALPEILQQTKVTTEKILYRLHSNYLTAKKILTTTPLSVLFTEGGWNAIIRFPSIMTDEQWVIKLLETKNVLIHPGHFFDLEGPYGVVSLLLPEEQFSKGMSTLKQFVCS
jgi:aspartate/methionine/tyrosine aminotransferase